MMEKAKLPKLMFAKDEFEKAEEQALESLRQSPAVYQAIKQLRLTKGLVKQFIGPLLDLKEDCDYCAHCPGLANCKKENPHFVLSLTLDGDFMDRHFDPCPKALEQEKREKRYLERDFPEEWMGEDLFKVDRSNKRADALIEMSKILQGESSRWLYLIGGKRSGKSILLASFCNTYADTVASPVAFLSVSSFLEEMKSLSFSDKSAFEARFAAYQTCPLLVFDALGEEYVSEYNFSSFLFPLLLARGRNNLLTCFSSSLKIDEVCSLYAPKIGPIRAKQMREFLKDSCQKEIDVGPGGLY